MTKVELPAGRHKVADGVVLDVGQLDPGTVISLLDANVNRRYTICIDECGIVVYRAIAPIDPEKEATTPAVVPPQGAPQVAHGPATPRRPSKLSIRVRYRDGRRDQTGWLFGGYRCDSNLVLLYRVRGRAGERDDILRVVGKEFRVLGPAMREEAKIDPADWDTFMGLPDNATFHLGGRSWTKLPLADLQYLNGTILRPLPVIGEERDLGY